MGSLLAAGLWFLAPLVAPTIKAFAVASALAATAAVIGFAHVVVTAVIAIFIGHLVLFAFIGAALAAVYHFATK